MTSDFMAKYKILIVSECGEPLTLDFSQWLLINGERYVKTVPVKKSEEYSVVVIHEAINDPS